MKVSRWLMVLLFIVSAVVVVEAQQPGRGGFGQTNVTNAVLSNKDLQAELKITDGQKDKFKEPAEKLTAIGKKFRESFKDKDKAAEVGKESEKLNEEIKKVVADTLTPDQMKRLKQIEYQAKGFRAFTNEEIAKELKITEAQSSKIKGIVEEFQKDSKGLGGFGGFGKDKDKAAENKTKLEKLTKGAQADIDETLTPDQKKQWKEMTGEPFDTAKLRQGFGGFGGAPKAKD